MLGRLRIRTKLLMVVLVPLGALVLAAVAGFIVLREARIGGGRYQTISSSNDLVADVLPPPGFIVETYLTAQQIAESPVDRVPGLIERIAQQRVGYEQAITRWTAEETDPEIRQTFLVEADQPARDFFAVLDEEFMAAVEANDREAEVVLLGGRMQELFEKHRAAIERVVALASARAGQTESDANGFVRRSLIALAIAVIGALVGALALGIIVARSIVRPVAALRRVAMEDLPATLNALRSVDLDSTTPIEVPSVELGTRDELNDAATAFNEVIGTAVGLAADQSKLRQHMTELMINLGKRNQVLLGSQLDMLDHMESSVQQPELLDGLFELDHLAARMRRNAESLLVLAGSRRTRSWSQPVLLSEVIQGAVGELSDFRRVDVVVPPQDDLPVSGQHTVDVAHILAELIENALQFSPPSTRVVVRTQRPKAGLRVWVSDMGVGMTEEELKVANDRVARPPEIDSLNADQVGYQVVARLSRRLGSLVRIQPHPAGGLAVAVDLPVSVFSTDEAPPAVQRPAPARRGESSGPMSRPAQRAIAPSADLNASRPARGEASATPPRTDNGPSDGGPMPRRQRPSDGVAASAGESASSRQAEPQRLVTRAPEPTIHGHTSNGLPQRRRAEPADDAPSGELPRRTRASAPSDEATFQLFNSRASTNATPRPSLGDFTRARRVADDGLDEGATDE